MRTDIISFVMSAENRKKIVKALFGYPKRQWSCSFMEDATKLPHATVFRALKGLRDFGILRSHKVNKKDIVFELVLESPVTQPLKNILDMDRIVAEMMMKEFAAKIRSPNLSAVLLYGSSVRNESVLGSDVDVMVILKKKNREMESKILATVGELSAKFNKTISSTIMSEREISYEKDTPFVKNVMRDMVVIYGKKPF